MSTSDRRTPTLKNIARCSLAVLALAPAVAVAANSTGIGRVTKFRAAFTTDRPGKPTGLVLKTTGKPPAHGVTEAPAVQQTVILPAGTKLRLDRLPQCNASDAQIASQGAEAACPSASRVGTGGADGLVSGTPVHFDIGIYAVRGHLVFAAEQGGHPLKQSFAGIARGRLLILTVPTLGGQIDPIEFDASIPSRPGAHAWLRTPAKCPASGHWLAVGKFRGLTATSGGHQVGPAQKKTARDACVAPARSG